MAHAGTMVGGSAQTKQSGSPWPAIALAVAVVVAMIAGVWLASSAGLVGGTAKPAADRSFDQIEAQRGAITQSLDRSRAAYDEKLSAILDGAHAAPYVAAAVTLPDNRPVDAPRLRSRPSARSAGLPTRRGYAIAAQSGTVTLHPVTPADTGHGARHAGSRRRPVATPSHVAERGPDAYLRPSSLRAWHGCEPGGIRTHDQGIKSPVLCR